MHTHRDVHTHSCVHTHAHMYKHTQSKRNTHICAHTHKVRDTYIYIQICTHIHMGTHTRVIYRHIQETINTCKKKLLEVNKSILFVFSLLRRKIICIKCVIFIKVLAVNTSKLCFIIQKKK